MPRKPESYWIDHIQKWKKSGLKPNAYSIKNNLSPATLSRWINKLEDKPRAIKISLPVKTVEKKIEQDIVIEIKTFMLKIPISVSPELLQIIIRELKQ